MNQLRRMGRVGYEDLMRELEVFEKSLLKEDPSMAMSLMALEAKIRERFQQFEMAQESKSEGIERLSLEDIQALIPQDLPPFPTLNDIDYNRKRKRLWETIGMAAALAVLTALGVFGMASLIQLILTWLV